MAAQKSELQAADAADRAALEKSLAAQKSELSASDAAIRAALGSGGKTCRITWASYVGSGNCGPNYPNKLTFDFKPHFIVVYPADGSSTRYFMRVPGNSMTNITWGENQLTWYVSSNLTAQMSQPGVTYYYVAIGESL